MAAFLARVALFADLPLLYLRRIAALKRRRGVNICAQAIVRVHSTYDEDVARLRRSQPKN